MGVDAFFLLMDHGYCAVKGDELPRGNRFWVNEASIQEILLITGLLGEMPTVIGCRFYVHPQAAVYIPKGRICAF